MKVKVCVSQASTISKSQKDRFMAKKKTLELQRGQGKTATKPLPYDQGKDAFLAERKQTQERLVRQAIRQSIDKGFDALVAKNTNTHDIESFNVDVKDYPQHTSTVGEETVQLVVTLTLNKKRK